MKTPIRNKPLINIISSTLIDLPTPSNISYWWNYGSLLGVCLIIQILTGLFLSMHYNSSIMEAFNSVNHICTNVNYGWILRTLHANGASFFFICLYLHIGRGLYYKSYNLINTWMIGVTIMFITMATAFLGYVLPWGQMSFWGATVITNLLSAIPYLGPNMVMWLWGGFAVDNATLNRFYSLHFIMPFIIIMMVMIHLLFLHETGSNNPLGVNSNIDKIPFHPYFSLKDLMGFMSMLMLMIMLIFIMPYKLSDPDNFIPANPLLTPIHIQPEWYFLFAYAILRSIPNKLGGVIALVMSIAILYFMPLMKNKIQSNMFYPTNKILLWILLMNIILLTWIGARPVEMPYIYIGQMMTMSYFSLFMMMPLISLKWENFMFKY